MKLAFFINLLFLSAVCATSYSQKSSFTLNLKDVTVKEVIKIIEARSDYRFFYNDELNDVSRKVNVNFKETSLDEILSELFDNTGITYKFLENKLVVIAPNTTIQPRKISGTVTDASTNEPIIGANVVIEGTTFGVITDINGNFTIEINQEKPVLFITYIGYNTEE
ncbi:MAG: hypothetical protein HC905_00295 [Bacteroidales bacterium]|nr:hypothetical protein [Bacteroidales bacterium]